MNKIIINAIAVVIISLTMSFSISVSAQQNRVDLPPPPNYAQPTQPMNGYRPTPYSGPNNYGPPRFVPSPYSNNRSRNFGPGFMRSPNFNTRNMPWNRVGRKGNNGFGTSSLPSGWMDSAQWARKVPDWGEHNGPYGNGPWGNERMQNRMEDMWDDMINAPHDMGRMPGGWKAPSISMPNPIDVGDQFGEQFDKLPGQIREMDVGND